MVVWLSCGHEQAAALAISPDGLLWPGRLRCRTCGELASYAITQEEERK